MNSPASLLIDENGNIITTSKDRNHTRLDTETQIANGVNLDAAGRFRISDAHSIYDCTQSFDDQPLFLESKITGNGSTEYSSDLAATKLKVTTTSGDKVIRQSREYFPYIPGKSYCIFISGLMGAIKSNVRQRIGIFDDDNGFFFEQNGSELRIVRRTKTSGSVVDNTYSQSSWNIDKLDGTGNSSITLDTSKVQLFIIDFLWLGVGRIRFGVNINGILYYCHEILISNVISTVSISNPNLPFRFELENTGTSASNTEMHQICTSIVSEGGFNPKGVIRTVSTGTDSATVGASYVPIISIRLKSSYKRAQLAPLVFKIFNDSNSLIHCKLMIRNTLTGASWTSAGTNSIAEYDTSATAFSGGEFITDAFVNSQWLNKDSIEAPVQRTILKVLADIDGTTDILSIVGKSDGATSNVHGSLTFTEIY